MIKIARKNLKYLIPMIFLVIFVLGLLFTIKNSQIGLQSNLYRFWGAFSLTSMFLMLLSMIILDSIERRKKKLQKGDITQQTQEFKEKIKIANNLIRFGISLGPISLFIPPYLSFLLPSEVYGYLFAPFSPFFIFYFTFEFICFFFVIIGWLYIAIKIKIEGLPERIPLKEAREFISTGSGTESDPYIIETLPKSLLLLNLGDSDHFVIVQNCYLEKILVDSCQNVRIINCNIWVIALQYCSKIFVNNSTIRRTLKLYESSNVKIEHCAIKILKIHVSKSNIIKKCSLKVVKYITGYDNILEANNIPEKHLNRIKKKYWYHWYKLKII